MATPNEEAYNSIIRSYRGNHRDVARVFCLIYKNRFIVRQFRKKPTLFSRRTYDTGYEITNITELRNTISDHLSKHYYAVAYSVFQDAYNENAEVINEKHLDVALSLIKIARHLCNPTYKSLLSKEILELLFEP
jgi:hypothetical protein